MKRRSKLMLLALSALVLGGLVTTFAVTTDSAQTGTNRIDSAANPTPNLQISHDAILATSYGQAPYGGDCDSAPPGGSYVENQTQGFGLTTGLINQTNAQPRTMAAGAQVTYFCLKNTGDADLTLTSENVASGSDADLACSPDELAADSGSCGTGAGELASEIRTETYVGPSDGTCVNPNGAADATTSNDGLSGGLHNFSTPVSMAVGTTRCVGVAAGYLDTLTTASERDANQTDRQEWVLQYNATS